MHLDHASRSQRDEDRVFESVLNRGVFYRNDDRALKLQGIAENLASYYLLYGDINLINTEIEMIHSITREEIRDVAKST